MIPFSASDLLRETSPRKTIGNTFFTANRFSHLRDDSPIRTNGSRNRSLSQKRKDTEDLSYLNAAKRSLPFGEPSKEKFDPELFETTSLNIAKVSSICDKIFKELEPVTENPAIVQALRDLGESIRLVNANQSVILKHLSAPCAQAQIPDRPTQNGTRPQNDMVPLGSLRNRLRAHVPASNLAEEPPVVDLEEDQASKAAKSFCNAVRDAEKSTLIFNLNMGTVPIMNTTTMSKKATLSLISMASQNEGRSSSSPSNDSVAAIDDILSMTKSMSFFGTTTKTYRNAKDPNSGAYCSIPVKYEFKDKDTRVRAEQILRSRCKVQCSTPYPPVLRACIKKTIEATCAAFPGSFVKVAVDPAKMCLKVAYRPEKSADRWTYIPKYVGLPADVLDVRSRIVPADLTLTDLPVAPTEAEAMVSSPAKTQSPPRPSRLDNHASDLIKQSKFPKTPLGGSQQKK